MKAVILAAGESSRMWPLAQHKNKAMYEFLGKPLLYYTIKEAKEAGINDLIIVISSDDKLIPNYFRKGEELGVKISYAVQKKTLGMGNALLSASKLIKGDFLLLHGTHANCGEIIKRIAAEKKNFVLVGRKTDNPENYGIMKLKGNKVLEVVEKPKKNIGKIKMVGIYLLPQKFLNALKGVKEHMYSFEDALQKMVKRSSAGCISVDDVEEISLKYPWHMLSVNKILMEKHLKRYHISISSKIDKSVILEGSVYIGENVRIFENAVIKGPCYIADNAIIGNNVLIRNNSYIGRNVQIGHNSEVKNSIIYDNSHVDNAVILDSVLDEECRLGSDTITANKRLDRKNVSSVVKGEKIDAKLGFFGAIIGKNTASGIHSGTMPGIKIGENCSIGPGTIVFNDMKDNSSLFHKYEQKND